VSAWLLLALAVVLVPAGRGGEPRTAGREPRTAGRRRGREADPGLPLVLDLMAAALRAGRPVADALELAAPAGRADTAATLGRVARLLRLGADPAEAWAAVPVKDPVGPVVPAAIRSARSGVRLAGACERLAAELRADRRAAGAARAQRAGVFAMAPLAACFLPSFVCLGVVPTVVGIAGAALGPPS